MAHHSVEGADYAHLLDHAIAALGTAAHPQNLSTVADSQLKFDALAIAIAQQSLALTAGAILVAVILAVLGFGWGKLIEQSATQDARREAERIIQAWLLDEAPRIIREGVSPLSMSQESPHITPDGDPADDIGRQAG